MLSRYQLVGQFVAKALVYSQKFDEILHQFLYGQTLWQNSKLSLFLKRKTLPNWQLVFSVVISH